MCNVVAEQYPALLNAISVAFPGAFSTSLNQFEENIRSLAEQFGQVILYGPPGSGKTRIARRVAAAIGGSKLVVFHPSYGYEEFIGGIRPEVVPVANGSAASIAFVTRRGAFLVACDLSTSAAQAGERFTLIIDEINRGDIARIFGEAIFSIERSKGSIAIPVAYSDSESLSVPDNLAIIGTMNSSDRSIALLDVALRRRFAFVEVPVDSSVLVGAMCGQVPLRGLMDGLNAAIGSRLGRDHLIGQAYFLDAKSDEAFTTLDQIRGAWNHRIAPLLEEYFFGREDELGEVLGHELAANPRETVEDVSCRCHRFDADGAFERAAMKFLESHRSPHASDTEPAQIDG